MERPYHPVAALAAALTIAGTVLELITLEGADPGGPRCGYLLLLLSLPLWIVAEVRRSAGRKVKDAYRAGYYDGAHQVERALGVEGTITSRCTTGLHATERHDR